MAQHKQGAADSDNTAQDAKPMKVLIVDESSVNIERLYQLMQSRFDVHFAKFEKTALTIGSAIEPDLVLVGIDGELVDGFALCHRLKLPVILFSTEWVVEDMVKALNSGAIDFLSLATIPMVESQATELNRRFEAHIILERQRQSLVQETAVAQSDDLEVVESNPNDGKAKLLIVDDSISNIQVLNEILGTDYQVFFATSGQQAIDMALDERPDLIILDVMMPHMDGYQVCTKLKQMEQTKNINIIFVTALNEERDEAKGLQMGAIDYIAKPFSADIVRARMHNHMELIAHRKRLDNLSMTDGLTGIPNRRQFDLVIERELHRARRQAEPLSVILIDIDNFKKYNDHYGHVSGDECLRKVASAIMSCRYRKTDAVSRYGGEEFTVVLPNTDKAGGLKFANKVLTAIYDLAIPHERNDDFAIVTASFGLYCGVPDQRVTVESIVDQADGFLYQAKSLGRNQIVCAQAD